MKTVIIGRSPDNSIVINDPYASGHHCQITQYDSRNFRLFDNNSKNGTFVNGRKITGEVILQPTDVIKIGNTTLPWQGYFAGGFYRKPQKKSNTWLVVVVIVAVLAAAGGLIWFLLPSSNGFNTEEELGSNGFKTEEEVGKKAFEMIKNINNISKKKFVDFFVSSIKVLDKDIFKVFEADEDEYREELGKDYRNIKDWKKKKEVKDMKYWWFERER